jgi:hypothetical protein
MKTIVTLFLLFFVLQIGMARKLVVTSTSDDIENPTDGMLRYFIKNFQYNDTITFDVDKVSLEGSLVITNSVIIDGSSRGMVTLDGQFKGRVFNIKPYYGYEVLIKNLKIVNGKISDSFAFGGGMYVFLGSGKSVTVENCIFQNNEANASSDGQGGALRTDGGTFINCSFINNKVTGTAGPQGGGGIMAIGGTFINCVIAGNTAKYGGGVYASDAKFYNCTVSGNIATNADAGGGIVSESAEIINCVSYSNFSNGVISNIDAYGKITLIKNCAFDLGNPLVTINYNIALVFSSPFKGGIGADSLSLAVESPCINAGTTSGIEILNTDFLGNSRISGGKIDIGAYEYNSPVTSILNNNLSNQSVVYPNPSSGKIYFKKDVLNSQILSVEIYTISGTQLYSIKEENVLQGFKIDQSGIFQLRVFTNEGVFHEKVVIQ